MHSGLRLKTGYLAKIGGCLKLPKKFQLAVKRAYTKTGDQK